MSALRRLLALSLSLCLLAGMIPMNVLAEDGAEPSPVSSDAPAAQAEESATSEPPAQDQTPQVPTPEEPSTQGPATQEPSTQGPTTQEPSTQVPTTQEPSTQGPTTQEPSTQEPAPQTPSTEGPGPVEPVVDETYTVTFHNKKSGAADEPLPLEAKAGTLLAQLVGDAAWADETLLKDCIWYAASDTGRKTPVDLTQTKVEGDMDLCTYDPPLPPISDPGDSGSDETPGEEPTTFTVTFHDMRTGEDTQTISLEAQPGAALNSLMGETVLWQDGVLLRDCRWYTLDETGEEPISVTPETLIQSDLDVYAAPDVDLMADDSPYTGMTAEENHTVNFYVFLNGERHLVDSRAVTAYYPASGRRYIPASLLEEVYKENYGFTEDQLVAGTRYFPHVDNDGTNIWADTPVYHHADTDTFFSPINNSGGAVSVYYLPKQTLQTDYASWSNFKSTESFYTVTIEDPSHRVYSAAEVPQTTYHLAGDPVTVTLKTAAGVDWLVKDKGDTITGDGNPTTYEISGINSKYTFIPQSAMEEGTKTAHFLISVNGSWTEISTQTDMPVYRCNNSAVGNYNRYYLTAQQLAAVYGKYGFEAGDLEVGQLTCFAHATTEDGLIYIDQNVISEGDIVYSPISNNDGEAWVYYVPLGLGGATNKNKAEIEQAQSLYPVTISDDSGWVYPSGTVPPVAYHLYNTEAAVTVTYKPDVKWVVKKGEEVISLTPTISGDQAAYSIQNIDSAYTFTPIPDMEPVTKNLHFMVSVNGGWKELPSQGITTVYKDNTAIEPGEDGNEYSRYYLTAQQLETIYSPYLFETGDLTAGSPSCFAYAPDNGNTIYFDKNVMGKHGTVYSPVTSTSSTGQDIYVYYLPVSETGTETNKTTVHGRQTFYTVAVEDPGQLVYTGQTLPETAYYLTGTQNVTATVETKPGVEWIVRKNRTTTAIAPTVNGAQATYTIGTIDASYVISTAPDIQAVTKTIRFFVSIDNKWTLLESKENMTVYQYNKKNDDGYNRYYLREDQLHEVYSAYGFDEADWPGNSTQSPFGYVGGDGSSATINFDKPVLTETMDDQQYAFFALTSTFNPSQTVSMFYLPRREVLTGDSVDKNNIHPTQSFYSVRIADPAKKAYPTGEIPTVDQVFLNGTNAAFTFASPDDIQWECRQLDGTLQTCTVAPDGNGKTTVTITGISGSSIVFPELADNEMFVIYDTNIRPEFKPVYEEFETPTVKNELIHETVVTNDHTVLAPEPQSYFYGHANNYYLGKATFLGWKIQGVETLISPGDVLFEKLPGGTSGYVSLVAHWKTEHANTSGNENDSANNIGKHSSMVNFFVSLNAQLGGIEHIDNNSGNINKFTDSVYTADCGIKTLENAENIGGHANLNQYIIRGSDGGQTGMTVQEAEAQVMELKTGYDQPDVVFNGETYKNHYQIDFPSDEEALLRIRRMVDGGEKITLGGNTLEELKAEDITTNRFKILWHVFKYSYSNGWHIDGVLMTKESKLTITKTFAGDPQAIEDIKADYSISVSAVPGQTGIVHGDAVTLTTSDTDPYLARHDTATDTYTWQVPVDQYYRYTVKENNYRPADDTLTTLSAQYRVSGSNADGENTGTWKKYPADSGEEVTVTAKEYTQGGDNLTVSFANTYTAPGTLILRKVDAATGQIMEGVSFQVSKGGDDGFVLYDLGNSIYSAEPTYATGHQNTNTVVTDAHGQIYLTLGGGTYYLTEKVPDGYEDPGQIMVELQGTEQNAYQVVAINNAAAANGTDKFLSYNQAADQDLLLTVKNHSPKVTVRVVKKWIDGTDKPVTIELFLGKKSMGVAELNSTKVLAGVDGWVQEFPDMPLYANGQLANYTVLETAIDGFLNSEEFQGGFKYYDVEYPGMEKLDENNMPTEVMDRVRTLSLTVQNKRRESGLAIRKVDGETGLGLDGAVFGLYSLSDDYDVSAEPPKVVPGNNGYELEAPLPPGVTDLGNTQSVNGDVKFGNKPAGKYFLVERAAPDRYECEPILYLLDFDGNTVSMSKRVDGTWVTMTGNQIENTSQNTEVHIKKLVEGNMGEITRPFSFTVECQETISEGAGYTLDSNRKIATFDLSHGGIMVLKGVKKGTWIKISEEAVGYTMTVSPGTRLEDKAIVEGDVTKTLPTWQCDIPADAQSPVKITVTNEKSDTPDTGVVLDSLPYVLLLAAAVIGGAVFLLRRKRRDD